jgi:hypothetical protein
MLCLKEAIEDTKSKGQLAVLRFTTSNLKEIGKKKIKNNCLQNTTQKTKD